MLHDLKVLPEYYDALVAGTKRFEVRRDDRNFRVGDTLELRKYQPGSGYTGHRRRFKVTYILRGGDFGIQDGYVVMSLILIS